jgi:NADH dehydrogenase
VSQPKIVIVGGGFGGLAAARALRKVPAKIILIDRTNHHVFRPLLYQVATSVLSTGQIASPIRGILRNQKNTTVILGEVTGVDKEQKCVFVSDADRENVSITYDYLVLATGVSHSYFGHDEFEQFAPGLKSLAGAVEIRNKLSNWTEAGPNIALTSLGLRNPSSVLLLGSSLLDCHFSQDWLALSNWHYTQGRTIPSFFMRK